MSNQLKKNILVDITKDIERVITEIESALAQIIVHPLTAKGMNYDINASNFETFAEKIERKLRTLQSEYLNYLVMLENIDFEKMEKFTSVQPWSLFEVAQYKGTNPTPRTKAYFMLPIGNYPAGEKIDLDDTNFCFVLSRTVVVNGEAYYPCGKNNQFYNAEVGAEEEGGGYFSKDILADPERMNQADYEELAAKTPTTYTQWYRKKLVTIT